MDKGRPSISSNSNSWIISTLSKSTVVCRGPFRKYYRNGFQVDVCTRVDANRSENWNKDGCGMFCTDMYITHRSSLLWLDWNSGTQRRSGTLCCLH